MSADYLPTAKNELVRDFLPEQGFEDLGEGRYRRDLRTVPPLAASEFPIQIIL